MLDPDVSDADLRAEIFRRVPPLELAAAVDEAERMTHPEGRAFFGYLDARYGYVRQFAPAFLDAIPLRPLPLRRRERPGCSGASRMLRCFADAQVLRPPRDP